MRELIDNLPLPPSMVQPDAGIHELRVALPATASSRHGVPQSSRVETPRLAPFALPFHPNSAKRKVVEDNTPAIKKSKFPMIMRETPPTTFDFKMPTDLFQRHTAPGKYNHSTVKIGANPEIRR